MKAIRRIARLELSALFYSPIAWLLLTVFIVQASMVFAMRLSVMLIRAVKGFGGADELTVTLFTASRGMLWQVTDYLYLFIPLLTMGLISRELNSGSVKLLLSSPLRIRDIVLGKYLAVVAYCGLLVTVLLLLLAVSGLFVEAVDYTAVVTAIFGIYLLACAYGAIGLFMSSLTQHQVVAAISTLAVLAALNFIGDVGQTVPLLRDVTYWLSLSGRVDVFRMGLITTKHIFYFLAVIGVFLSFTILKLSAGRQLESRGRQAARYAAVTFVAVILGYVTSLPALTAYFDTTRIKSQSLTPASVDVIEQIEGPWRITSYVNVLDRFARYGFPSQRKQDFDRLEQYLRYNPKLEMDYVMYYGPSENERLYKSNPGKSDAELAKQQLEMTSVGLSFDELLTPEAVNAEIDVESERYRLTRRVDWGGNSALLRMYDDINQHPKEAEITAALKRLLVGPKTITSVTGHGERSAFRKDLEDYRLGLTEIGDRGAMISHGFDVIETSLGEAIPASTDILISADPKLSYSADKLARIEAYIAAGGNALFAVEPSRRDTASTLLAGIGVELRPGQIRQSHEDLSDDVVFARYAAGVQRQGFVPPSQLEYLPVLLNGASAIKINPDGPFDATPLLLSEDKEEPLAVMLTRELGGREQRVVVVGDADFMSNGEYRRRGVFTNNEDFVADLFYWLSDGEYPVPIERADFPDKRLLTDSSGIAGFKFVFYGVLPSLIVLFSAWFLLRRRRF